MRYSALGSEACPWVNTLYRKGLLTKGEDALDARITLKNLLDLADSLYFLLAFEEKNKGLQLTLTLRQKLACAISGAASLIPEHRGDIFDFPRPREVVLDAACLEAYQALCNEGRVFMDAHVQASLAGENPVAQFLASPEFVLYEEFFRAKAYRRRLISSFKPNLVQQVIYY